MFIYTFGMANFDPYARPALPGAFHFVHGVDVGGPAGIAAYFRPLMTPAPKSGNRYNIYV